MRVRYDVLTAFTDRVLAQAGLDDSSREAVTLGLCETSLRGVDSHGIRLLPHYVRSAGSGRKNPRPDYRFTRTLPAFGHLDADNAFGHAAGMKAIDLGMEMAAEIGLAAIGVSNSSHPGAMASFVLKAARRGYVAFAFTHADALILSTNGTRPLFGTNPVCMAAPRDGMPPYCIDMATSAIPWNRLLIHKANGLPLAPGQAGDSEGNETTDPDTATCLLPTGDYKGYALASMVEVLCGVLTGMAFGRDIPAMYQAPMEEPRRLGQFYLVMRADGCIPQALFELRMRELTEAVRAEPAKPGAAQPVMLPGDREEREAERRLAGGIPLDPATAAALQELAAQQGVPLEMVA